MVGLAGSETVKLIAIENEQNHLIALDAIHFFFFCSLKILANRFFSWQILQFVGVSIGKIKKSIRTTAWCWVTWTDIDIRFGARYSQIISYWRPNALHSFAFDVSWIYKIEIEIAMKFIWINDFRTKRKKKNMPNELLRYAWPFIAIGMAHTNTHDYLFHFSLDFPNTPFAPNLFQCLVIYD